MVKHIAVLAFSLVSLSALAAPNFVKVEGPQAEAYRQSLLHFMDRQAIVPGTGCNLESVMLTEGAIIDADVMIDNMSAAVPTFKFEVDSRPSSSELDQIYVRADLQAKKTSITLLETTYLQDPKNLKGPIVPKTTKIVCSLITI